MQLTSGARGAAPVTWIRAGSAIPAEARTAVGAEAGAGAGEGTSVFGAKCSHASPRQCGRYDVVSPRNRSPQNRSWYSRRFASNRAASTTRRRRVGAERYTYEAPTQTPRNPARAAWML